MARTRITKRVKYCAPEAAIQSQIISVTNTDPPVSSVTATGSKTPVINYSVDTEGVLKTGDASTLQECIPGKRKADSDDDTEEEDEKPVAVVAGTAEMKSDLVDGNEDDATLDVDYEVTSTETANEDCCVHCSLLEMVYVVTTDTVKARHDCCIHCPVLERYIMYHGKRPPDPAKNKQV
jgi:hypothetical protein